MAGSGKTGSTSLRNKLHKMQTQKVIVSILFLCVPLLLLFTFTYLPFFKMVQFSFYDMKYIGKRTWVGLQNYISVFTREDCLNALKRAFSIWLARLYKSPSHCYLPAF